jgi:hypothetical protein
MLRQRCEGLLRDGEQILLVAESTMLKLGLLRQAGSGYACLTDQRIIWIRRGISLFWIPSMLAIDRSSIIAPYLVRDVTRSWLVLKTEPETYSLRLGMGPYPKLTDNPETTEVWAHALGISHPTPPERGYSRTPNDPTRVAGILLIALVLILAPAWLVGLSLIDASVWFYIVIGLLTLLLSFLGVLLIIYRSRRGTPPYGP